MPDGHAARFGSLAAALVALLGGCEPATAPDAVCLLYAAPAITAVVYDATTLTTAVGALVTATDGNYVDSARVTATVPMVALAYERAGSYAVTASKPGYAAVVAQVRVTADRCHVITVPLSFLLAPEPAP
jgi:hypothetical protein